MKTITMIDCPSAARLEYCRRYQGVLQILEFNWPWYALALAIFALAAAVLPRLNVAPIFKVMIGFGIGCACFWMLASVLVSHWVYDLSGLTQWDWIKNILQGKINRAAQIHCGFDECRGTIHRLWPSATMSAWDIYRPDLMTEGSIARARQNSTAPTAVSVCYANLPESGDALDTILLIFAAHEIRSGSARDEFFHELFRILKPGGTILLVEHLRDWRNFAAYGPGFFHFLPLKEWLRLAGTSGFLVAAKFRFTPFVLALKLRKPENL